MAADRIDCPNPALAPKRLSRFRNRATIDDIGFPDLAQIVGLVKTAR
jgi:hypothetical protein